MAVGTADAFWSTSAPLGIEIARSRSADLPTQGWSAAQTVANPYRLNTPSFVGMANPTYRYRRTTYAHSDAFVPMNPVPVGDTSVRFSRRKVV